MTLHPNQLQPGDELILSVSGNQRQAFFVRRYPARWLQPAVNVLRVPAYEGLEGEYDRGNVQMDDREFTQRCRLANEG